jgi:excisionase family DNA binding protein
MYVNVQRAAARLGVSVVTIRRWTDSGFLPCTRTQGGHRRISTDDLDELALSIGASDARVAKVARERELETVVSTSIALGGKLDLPELLAEIARQVTRILHTDYCTIYEYDAEKRLVRMMADYDRHGGRWPEAGPYLLKDYPLSRRVIDEQIVAMVNRDDPNADPAELSTLLVDNDASMLTVPIVHQGVSIGALETIDHERSRTWDRQELRMVRAIAAQAGLAIVNARTVAEIRADELELADLEGRLSHVKSVLVDAASSTSPEAFLDDLAQGVCAAFDGISCVAKAHGISAGAAGAPPRDDGDAGAAHVVSVSDPTALTDLSLTLTLRRPPSDAAVRLLELVAVCGAGLLGTLG